MLYIHKLGSYLRGKYNDFLGPVYNLQNVAVTSTLVNRTFMSAESLLAGLFKPTSYQIFNQNITWQPIPIFTNNDLDHSVNCPRFSALTSIMVNSKFYKNAANQYQVSKIHKYFWIFFVSHHMSFLYLTIFLKNFTNVINQFTGTTNATLLSIWQSNLCDTIYIEVYLFIL